MTRFYIPTKSADDWKTLLVDSEKQWRSGYSAKSLAYCWESASQFPLEIENLFLSSGVAAFQEIQLLLAFPEHKVPLPGGKAESQNDLFVLAKDYDGHLVALTVEGKVSEAFGPTLGEWYNLPSSGKEARLQYIRQELGLSETIPSNVRYQLLHRTVSALIEAKRFNARSAVMIVHSFSPNNRWFEDYKTFLTVFGTRGEIGELVFLKQLGDIKLYAGWANGDARFLQI